VIAKHISAAQIAGESVKEDHGSTDCPDAAHESTAVGAGSPALVTERGSDGVHLVGINRIATNLPPPECPRAASFNVVRLAAV
jgi:hypothetical protein